MNSIEKWNEMENDKLESEKTPEKKKFLITGITGFAGAHLAQLLYNHGHEVYGLIRKSNGMESDILDTVSLDCFQSIKFIFGDLQDREGIERIFSEYKFDGVFHLAAQSHPPTSFTNPIDTYRTNIMGSAYLMDAIERHQPNCKYMQCSTSEVYGNSGSDGRHLKETDPLAPCNPYAVSKAASDLSLQERMMNGKINGFITRAFSHTGVRRGRTFSISADAYQIARMLTDDSAPRIIEVGNLETVRTVIDVRDVVNAYYLLMMHPESSGKVFNVCGDTPRKMGYFTDYLIQRSGLDIEKKISEKFYRKIDIAYQIGDTTALKELTGWTPSIPINDTLDSLLAYWITKMKK